MACSVGVPTSRVESSEAAKAGVGLTQTIRFDPVDIGARLLEPTMWRAS